MSARATGSFEVKRWDERPYDEIEGLPRLTRASVTQVCHGDIEADMTIEYLMAYRDDGAATILGQARVIGRIGDRPGSFVLQVIGIYRGGTVQGAWSVIPGSATGNLRGLQGEGSFVAPSGQPESWQFALDYDFDSAERSAQL